MAPWAAAVPDIFGDPFPITVLQHIRVGLLLLDFALMIA